MNSNIYRKIMVATDGSELIKKAVDTAVEVAKLSEAKLYAVYVVSSGGGSMAHPRDLGWEKAMKEHLTTEGKEATAYVETAGKAADVEVESVILEGSPAHEIIDFAEKNNMDLIVMGTLGRTGIQKFLLGSVAQNVVRHSRKAVLVVKEMEAK
ncbi:universal stress protein [Methanosarcina sp. 2.H.T.1A.6]|uniref:universal stress protein n=1 Tax=unclassified Methanosarcina TaxID=2644672 RepID=UPI0006227C17|nr:MULTISPECIES: universal stress protein [unclassified Methanosarcina]KKG12402.1 universal stress protein [Methanosarcina sp. 2.H.T.1A.15]KKG13882.1 universal stress protein [Methanosarcina sp. 2.H.T.1A.3]KKG21666.1 universal stress protein [Methanosarcina sp. 2.H.T.1A.8]KKG25073.1 universal stress protein [Methanosarcina sp. 2.H.T.1A.6]